MKTVVWIILAALVVVLLMINWPEDDRPKIDPKLQRSLDSSDVTRTDFLRRRDSVERIAVLDTLIARRQSDRADSLARAARRARARADSLARLGTEWRAAYEARTEEADSLSVALVQKDSAWRSERSSRINFQRIAAEETARRRSLETLNGGLRSTIASLERPCRLVGPIPCPNRRTSALLAAVAGYAAGKQ